MKEVEAKAPVPGGQLWPLSVEGYHALGQAGLIPEQTELLYGFVYQKSPNSALQAISSNSCWNFFARFCLRVFCSAPSSSNACLNPSVDFPHRYGA